jgi:hypothetical protein
MHPFFPFFPLVHGQRCANRSRPHSSASAAVAPVVAEREYLPFGRAVGLVAAAVTVPNKNTGLVLWAGPLCTSRPPPPVADTSSTRRSRTAAAVVSQEGRTSATLYGNARHVAVLLASGRTGPAAGI